MAWPAVGWRQIGELQEMVLHLVAAQNHRDLAQDLPRAALNQYTSFDTAHVISRPLGGMIFRDMLQIDPDLRTRHLTTFDDQSAETSR